MTETNKRIPLDFSNYSNLWELFQNDQAKFASLVRGLLTLLDKTVASKHHTTIEEVFKLEYPQLLGILTDAMTDYQGILAKHPNKGEAASMEILELENNPLAIFAGSPAFNLEGEQIPPQEFFGTNDIKDWFQGLLYASRFIPVYELAKYIHLSQFDLIDNLKAQNVQRLLAIQPALTYQNENDIPLAKRIKNSGYFWLGEHSKNDSCPACQGKNIEKMDHYLICTACNGGWYGI